MKMKITLHGVAYEVEVEMLDDEGGFYRGQSIPTMPLIKATTSNIPTFATSAVPQRPVEPTASNEKQITAPVGGTIISVKLKAGDKVKIGDEILVIEAMKMHTAIAAPHEGTIKRIPVAAGDIVREGQTLVEFD